jgi:hypothetical protein
VQEQITLLLRGMHCLDAYGATFLLLCVCRCCLFVCVVMSLLLHLFVSPLLFVLLLLFVFSIIPLQAFCTAT